MRMYYGKAYNETPSVFAVVIDCLLWLAAVATVVVFFAQLYLHRT